jgi:hypothetical protein
VPASEFVQQEPLEGQPATEPTEVWVFYDGSNTTRKVSRSPRTSVFDGSTGLAAISTWSIPTGAIPLWNVDSRSSRTVAWS